jgi:ribonuclease R
MEDAFVAMRELAEILRAKLRERGTLEFEFPETEVDLDEEGRPVAIYPYPISFTNGIIEAFMIAANEFVAEKFHALKLPFVYRVHELPDPDKLRRFMRLANNLGVRVRFRGNPRPADLAAALGEIKDMEYGEALSQLLLRSLAKARYAPECLGHFGLASTYYCHFTSPIRRYPDLFIHRVIKGWLSNRMHRTMEAGGSPGE